MTSNNVQLSPMMGIDATQGAGWYNRLSKGVAGCLAVLAAVCCLAAGPAAAQDMRKAYQDLEKKKQEMAQQAARELTLAKAAAREKAMSIKRDKAALQNAIAGLKAANQNLAGENEGLAKKIIRLREAGEKLSVELAESRAVNKELAGFVNTYAKDLKALLVQSQSSGLARERDRFLAPVINQERFWSMDDLTRMADILFEEISISGQVRMTRGPIIDRQGKDRMADILTLGNFTGIYILHTEAGAVQEMGFLLYSDASQRFFALSKLPSDRLRAQIAAYLDGSSASVPVDMSKGGALRQLVHQLDLAEQVPKGGPIVWPILAILAVALLILLERLFFFARRRVGVEPFMARIRGYVDQEDWDGCHTFLTKQKQRLIPRVLLAALPFRDHSRQDMENALQEAILGEIPAIERFLSTLGMLAAIAPLMGLLGTVTGMINTFHVITYYGAGDPRMMSGGISEALVTTMLGLSVAIPIMLCHTLLSRRVETQISRMEEKAVAFVNLVFKARNECRPGITP